MQRGWKIPVAAVDLGTSRVRAWHPTDGAVLDEPSFVAIDEYQGQACAVGAAARNMVGRSPEGLTVRRAVEMGRVTDFEAARMLARHALDHARLPRLSRRPIVVTAAPVDCSQMQLRTLEQALLRVGAAQAVVVPAAVAAALSGPLRFTEGVDGMLVDAGAGTSELAVFAQGRMVDARSVPIGGDVLDRAVADRVRHEYQVTLGPVAAERLRVEADPDGSGGTTLLQARGRQVGNGDNQVVHVSRSELRDACAPALADLAAAVLRMLTRCPPELRSRIAAQGLVLTGGLARGTWLRDGLADSLGIPVRVAADPDTRTPAGLGLLTENPDQARELALRC